MFYGLEFFLDECFLFAQGGEDAGVWADAFLGDVDAEVVDLVGEVVGEGDEVLG